MAYSTQDDILQKISEKDLAQLTSEDDEVIDDAKVSAAIAAGDSEINSYIGVRYDLPLATVPATVKELSVKLALYNLFSNRSNRLGGIDEVVKQNYDNAIDMLKNIARGLATLGINPPPAASNPGDTSFKGGTRDFTRDTLEGY